MDHETVLEKFQLLGHKVERLIEVIHQLRRDNEALNQEKELISAQLAAKADTEKQNDELKALVKSRIDDMMGKLAEFVED